MTDLTFRNLNKFVVSFRAGGNERTRNSFEKYYMPLLEIKDFNVLIDNKPFLDQVVKQDAYEKLAEMSRNNEAMIIQQELY